MARDSFHLRLRILLPLTMTVESSSYKWIHLFSHFGLMCFSGPQRNSSKG
jgi:hypothetical protein